MESIAEFSMIWGLHKTGRAIRRSFMDGELFFLPQHFQKSRFVDYTNAKLVGACQLTAGGFTRNDKIGFSGD